MLRAATGGADRTPASESALDDALRRLLAVGHTSGADLATGLAIGLSAPHFGTRPQARLDHQAAIRGPSVKTGRGSDVAPQASEGSGGPVEHLEVRRGIYHDSVTLLRISQAASDAPGIIAAQVAMATPLNTELAAGLGFPVPTGAGPNDLMVAMRGVDDAAITAGLDAIEGALAAAHSAALNPGGLGADAAPRTVRTALAGTPDASVVLLSVPGTAVIGEAMDAIAARRHVMIFSDNVPLAHEVALKDAAAREGVLVMGPDCGTAIVGGVGLGFANVLGRPTAPSRPPGRFPRSG